MTVLERISKIGIVPVVAIDNAADSIPLAEALIEGGLDCAEITFRTDAAEESIRSISERFPQMLVGAGTVLTTEQADRAIAAGAKFIVSPGLNPKVVAHCLDKETVIIPGCANPSDIEAALELGLEVVKFFPAEAAGGLKMIKAMSAPYTKVKFMPTGGITPDNVLDYLKFNKIIACGGSWMVSKELIEAGDFGKIKALTKEAVEKMLGFSLAHIGVNETGEDKAEATAKKLEDLFGFTKKSGSSGVMAGGAVELLYQPYLGDKGHIAIGTNFIERAIYHLAQRGAEFNEQSRKTDAKGNTKAIYLNDNFSGFALHLMQK